MVFDLLREEWIDRLIEIALKARGLIVMVTLAVIAFGAYEYSRMPVDAFLIGERVSRGERFG